MKVFILESTNPNDLLVERNEAESLLKICKMFDHETATLKVKNEDELFSTLRYLSDIELYDDDYLCIHFSCHGNEEGLAFGGDFVDWETFLDSMKPFFTKIKLKEKYSIILSACYANKQSLSKKISKIDFEDNFNGYPPDYILIYDQDEVIWKDALLSWVILYHQLSDKSSIIKKELQQLMKRMKNSGFGNLIYLRWDNTENKYKKYTPRV